MRVFGLSGEDYEKLEKTINRYNRIVKKLEKEYKGINTLLPERVKFSEVLSEIESRAGFRKTISDLERLSKKRNQQIIQVDEDLKTVRYTESILKSNVRLGIKQIDKEIEERKKELQRRSPGVNMDILVFFDNKISVLRSQQEKLKSYSKDIKTGLLGAKERLRYSYYGREELKRVVKQGEIYSSPDRSSKMAKIFKENYLRTLEKYAYTNEYYKKITDVIRAMYAKDFYDRIKDIDTAFINDLTYISGTGFRDSEWQEFASTIYKALTGNDIEEKTYSA